MAADQEYYSPLGCVCRIQFGAVETQSLLEGDYRFEELFCKKWNAKCPEKPLKRIWDISGLWGELWDEDGEEPHHQMGGYPYFTQNDPREGGRYPELDVLLFQIDSDGQDGHDLIVWGDCGVANFFISREDLKKRDFSKAGYNWDCC